MVDLVSAKKKFHLFFYIASRKLPSTTQTPILKQNLLFFKDFMKKKDSSVLQMRFTWPHMDQALYNQKQLVY